MGKLYKQTIHDVNLTGLTVLVRVDYNVPLTDQGEISDDLRIRASLPTLRYLIEQNCKIILISHLGRPKGYDSSLSLRPVAGRLAELLGQEVDFVDDCVGNKVKQAARRMASGDVLLLENLRFYEEEEADDMVFAQAIVKATRAQYFVQDGFAVTHRAHASTRSIPLCLPGLAGDLVRREYTTLTEAVENPERPMVAVIGGAKIADKIDMIYRFIDMADVILIGGAMANTFLLHKGFHMGSSLVEPDEKVVIDKIYKKAGQKLGSENVDSLLVLPTDLAVGEKTDSSDSRREVAIDKMASSYKALDIGTQTIEKFTQEIGRARTIIWNGPLGYIQNKTFAIGSARLAMAIAQNGLATSVIGGGDTADFVLKWDGQDGANFTHISTGGGASLELMSGKKLPGIESLLDAYGLK